jgi:hypothetical protein
MNKRIGRGPALQVSSTDRTTGRIYSHVSQARSRSRNRMRGLVHLLTSRPAADQKQALTFPNRSNGLALIRRSKRNKQRSTNATFCKVDISEVINTTRARQIKLLLEVAPEIRRGLSYPISHRRETVNR